MTRAHLDYARVNEIIAPRLGVDVTTPVAGFFKIKLGRDTVVRAVEVYYGAPHDPVTGEELDRSWRWQARLDDGTLIDFDRVWPACARDPISEAEFRRCVARTDWARTHAPGSSYADSRKRRDPLSTSEPLPF